MVKIYFRRKKSGVPILRKNEIEAMAELLLRDYDAEVLKEPGALDIEHFAENYVGLEMDYQDLSHNRSILGMMVFADCLVPVYDAERNEAKYIKANEGTLLIDNGLLRDDQIRRGRFTMGHEVAHWLLHRNKYKPGQGQAPSFACSTRPFIKCRTWDVGNRRRKFTSDDDWMEWQADYMSSALLMPRSTFTKAVLEKFNSVGIDAGYYEWGSNIALDLWIQFLGYELADLFNVSVTAARIRFENLQLVTVQSQNRWHI
ncbi:MAG TPA: ImmA/IrrE family metallo-endopeptidase [Firmicutes bacterium]|nr:ImmA/IrrE family metallo-endopeptidase [Bacillota bacterium]